MDKSPSLVLCRNDLRLNDNAAISAARQLTDTSGTPVLPVFIYSPQEAGQFQPGSASQWWLHKSLESLSRSISKRNGQLLISKGPECASILDLVKRTGAKHVFFNARYEPLGRKLDALIEEALQDVGVSVHMTCSTLLHDPASVLTAQGMPYKVFTPFWKSLQKHHPRKPIASDKVSFVPPIAMPQSLAVEQLALLPKVNWTQAMEGEWEPGEAGANHRLKDFLNGAVANYKDGRDRPDRNHVSKLSPHLHFGEISATTIWHAVQRTLVLNQGCETGCESFLRELAWREFAYHILYHFPETAQLPLRPQFKHFPFRDNHDHLQAWQRGRTGYPLVDAGMRELWDLGWMHNRVRMIVASFLVKHLLISWQDGAAWFWDTLVDADLANNTLGWQWTAGCGADAAPYFRIFNPVLQGEKFDPNGDYVKRWVPELRNLNEKWIHHPWDAPPAELKRSGIELGKDYPHPIIDHAQARARALAAFETIKATQAD